jgi:hypothetical protein
VLKDPKGLVARGDRPGASGKVQAGIWMRNGFFREIPESARDANGQVHEILVPADESLHVSVTPQGMRLLDSAGSGMPRGTVALAVVTKRSEALKSVELSTEVETVR